MNLRVLCTHLLIYRICLLAQRRRKCPEGIEERIGFLFCVYKNLPKVQEQLRPQNVLGQDKKLSRLIYAIKYCLVNFESNAVVGN